MVKMIMLLMRSTTKLSVSFNYVIHCKDDCKTQVRSVWLFKKMLTLQTFNQVPSEYILVMSEWNVYDHFVTPYVTNCNGTKLTSNVSLLFI